MRTISSLLILEKNKLSSTYPWLILLDITIPSTPSTTIYLVRNTEDITFNGQTYTAFPFEVEATKETAKGQIPTVNLRVSNVTRAIQVYLEAYSGLVGQTVTMRVVNHNYLSESYTDLTFTFEILECTSNVQWVDFTLGVANPFSRRFPLYRYIANYCRYSAKFKGVECKAKAGSVVYFSTTPSDGGSGYAAGDVLTLTSGAGTGARAEVATVDGSGVVTAITAKPVIPGYSYVVAANLTTSGGGGSGCKVEIATILPSTCDGLLSSCQAYNNDKNFGGFPGLATGGLRLNLG